MINRYRKALYASIVSALIIIGSIFYFANSYQKLRINKMSKSNVKIVNGFSSEIVQILLDKVKRGKNSCVFTLPLIQAIISSESNKLLADRFDLPVDRRSQTSLFSSIERALKGYSEDWRYGTFETHGFVSKIELYSLGNLYSLAGNGRIEELNLKTMEKDVSSWLESSLFFSVNLEGGVNQSVLTSKFEATWESGSETTLFKEFTLDDGRIQNCEYMNRTGMVKWGGSDSFESVFTGFMGGRLGMLLLKPGNSEPLFEVIPTLSKTCLLDFVKASSDGYGFVKVPMLDLVAGVRVNESDLLPEIVERKGCVRRIDQINSLKLHTKGVVEGKEAPNELESAGYQEIVFDRPFLFAIIDTVDGVILCVGAVMNPASCPVIQ